MYSFRLAYPKNAAGSGASRVEQTDGAFGNHAAYAALERLTQLDGGTNDKAEGGGEQHAEPARLCLLYSFAMQNRSRSYVAVLARVT